MNKLKSWWNTRQKWQKVAGLYFLIMLVLYTLELTGHVGQKIVGFAQAAVIFHAIYFGWNKLIQVLKWRYRER